MRCCCSSTTYSTIATGKSPGSGSRCSEFGRRFDSFVDWVVHAAFFAALGAGTAAVRGGEVWLWLGWIAAAGSTINYVVAFYLEFRDREAGESDPHAAPGDAVKPANWKEWCVFALRELSRADFCFIVLVLTLFDVRWVLLPAGAVGAQVYWATQFIRRAREFHV